MEPKPIEPRNVTFSKSISSFFALPAIRFILRSTAAAPAMSMRPSSATLVTPPSISSVEICISFFLFLRCKGFVRSAFTSQIVLDDCDNPVTDAKDQKRSLRLVEKERKSCASLLIGRVILDSALPFSNS